MSLINFDKTHLYISDHCSFLVFGFENSIQTINEQVTIRGG